MLYIWLTLAFERQENLSMVKLDFSKSADGLIPAIAQDYRTGEVLMLAYLNEEAWNKTLETGIATYWTRSRKKLWIKGESSGNIQKVKEILVDCDLDTVIFKIEQVGDAACHEGYRSCFFRRVEADGSLSVQGERIFDPAKVYQK
jgi:phosphoribosyl-AMP cyclohydrolase